MVMSPQYFRSDIVYDVDLSEHKKLQGKWITATTVVCCILMQICVVSQKKLQALFLDPAGLLPSPRTPVFFYVLPQ